MQDRPAVQALLRHRAGKDLGLTSWPGDAWKIGGGAVWGWLSYDPALNLVYHGTSIPAVEPGHAAGRQQVDVRRSSPATPDTGELVWALQVTPHDIWDYDAVNENILVDLPVKGQTRSARPLRSERLRVYAGPRDGRGVLAQPYVR